MMTLESRGLDIRSLTEGESFASGKTKTLRFKTEGADTAQAGFCNLVEDTM